MAVQPPGAQVSEDGHYWWDEQAQQWQPVEDGAASTASSSAAASGSDGEPAAGDSAQADASIEGACLTSDLADAEIEQILTAAGASLEQT